MKSLSILFSFLVVSGSLLFVNCGGVNAEKSILILPQSKLPAALPADAEMSFGGGYKHLPVYFNVKVSGETMHVEERGVDEKLSRNWSVTLSPDETNRLYKTFLDSKFDLIKVDKASGYDLDAPSENISLRAGGDSYDVSSGVSHPLSGDNLKRYKDVESAFTNLLDKYRRETKSEKLTYAVIKLDPETDGYVFKNAQPAELSEDEIAQVNKLVENAVADFNKNDKFKRKLGNLSEYKFQYVPATIENGEKHIWINAFCAGSEDTWRKQIVMVMDGGSCFFNFKLNLKTSAAYDFGVNGEA